MKITFLGAAQQVTGSCYLIETGEVKFLVDCGMFQGGTQADRHNAEPFRFVPKDIAFVLLTHAHIDHSGLLPKLVAAGFDGPTYTTTATADLLQVMLPDSAHIQEIEAERENRRREDKPGKKHKHSEKAVPLYSMADAVASLRKLVPISYDTQLDPHPTVKCRFRDAGHILGSAIVEVWLKGKNKETKLVFSGDLGQPDRPILRDPTAIEEADILLVESTYGNRQHKDLSATLEEFVHAINDTLLRKKGNVIIPSFAVGRTQEILYFLYDLTRQGRFKDLKVYVDSPMATKATDITFRHMEMFDEEAKKLTAWQAHNHVPLDLTFTGSADESIALNSIHSGAIIISASGMCDAGRIKFHLINNLGKSQNTILITGFQAENTLGRRLVDGAKTARIYGKDIPVRAQIYTIGGFSAHADQPALLGWLKQFRHPPMHTFVIHGETHAAQALADKIREMDWEVTVPNLGESVIF
ncbi:MAG: MBL fold metallo-hydrolase [Sulfuricella sp.]|nr:MBL fold metallo-hydrolase [Sulfuricella sp.]